MRNQAHLGCFKAIEGEVRRGGKVSRIDIQPIRTRLECGPARSDALGAGKRSAVATPCKLERTVYT